MKLRMKIAMALHLVTIMGLGAFGMVAAMVHQPLTPSGADGDTLAIELGGDKLPPSLRNDGATHVCPILGQCYPPHR